MIQIHVIVFIGLFLLWIAGKTGLWMPRLLQNLKGRRLFYLIALIGNLTGLILSIQSMQERFYPDEVRFEKGESLSVEHRLYTNSLEESVEVRVLVPPKETEAEDVPVEETSNLGKELEEEIRRLNQEKEDSEYYYLPVSYNGKRLLWEKPADHSGNLLGCMSLLVGIILLFLQEREKASQAKKREETLLWEYPEFIMKFTLLMEAGMTTRSAFARIGQDSEKSQSEKKWIVGEEVRAACHEMESGVTEKEAYRHFASRCGQSKYRTFVSLLNQNLQKGNARLLELLEKESYEAWSERRRRAKVEGEKAVTRLLLPMILMLLVVMALIMIPAFMTFYGV